MNSSKLKITGTEVFLDELSHKVCLGVHSQPLDLQITIKKLQVAHSFYSLKMKLIPESCLAETHWLGSRSWGPLWSCSWGCRGWSLGWPASWRPAAPRNWRLLFLQAHFAEQRLPETQRRRDEWGRGPETRGTIIIIERESLITGMNNAEGFFSSLKSLPGSTVNKV